MKHNTPLSPEHLAVLKKSKDHWMAGGKPIAAGALPQMDFKPLQVKPHPRQADIDAFRAVRSLVL